MSNVLAHYGLREAPFQVTSNPRYLYPSTAHEESFAKLRYGIEERKGFVLLTGEVGTGKTTLLRRLMETLEPKTPFVFLFNTRLAFDEILAFVCDELGIVARGRRRVDRIQALNEFLVEQAARGRTTALLIDEAQNLSDETLEELRLLSNLETRDEKLLQIVLVGQPELEEKLARRELRQLRQRITLRGHLDRLTAKEVRGFVETRLRVAGYRGAPLFTPAAMRMIARFSRGIPRLVNVLCDNALLLACSSNERPIDEGTIADVAVDLELASEKQDLGITEVGIDHALRDLERATHAGALPTMTGSLPAGARLPPTKTGPSPTVSAAARAASRFARGRLEDSAATVLAFTAAIGALLLAFEVAGRPGLGKGPSPLSPAGVELGADAAAIAPRSAIAPTTEPAAQLEKQDDRRSAAPRAEEIPTPVASRSAVDPALEHRAIAALARPMRSEALAPEAPGWVQLAIE